MCGVAGAALNRACGALLSFLQHHRKDVKEAADRAEMMRSGSVLTQKAIGKQSDHYHACGFLPPSHHGLWLAAIIYVMALVCISETGSLDGLWNVCNAVVRWSCVAVAWGQRTTIATPVTPL